MRPVWIHTPLPTPPVPPAGDPPRTAALLVIGNELLSGKVDDANVVVLARELRGLGVVLRRVVMILDDVAEISREIRELSASHDWLFTSGGVGPTHDDLTTEAAAAAFGLPVAPAPELEELLRAHYKERLTEGHLRMALVPEGATLSRTPSVPWPAIRIRNVWLLPGVPEIFRAKMAVVAASLGAGRPFHSRAVYTKMDEGVLKPLLDAVVASFPDVDVGSYPRWSDPSYKTKLTFDGRDADRVRAAQEAFVATLPEGEPQRVE